MNNEEDLKSLEEIDSPEADIGVTTPETIEEKYASQMREISTQKVELPLTALADMLTPKTGQIILSPEFQRREIWDDVRRSRFIESIIMNIPLPPVFLGEVDYGQWVVLDGRQRLTAVFEFKRNNYSLKGLKVWKELNGKKYSHLEADGLDKFLNRQFLPAVTVKKESSSQVKYDVFERLNTGGIVALPMEIRNAVFRGEFNKSLHELSNLPDFMFLWAVPPDTAKKEKTPFFNRMYDLEQVLRFFAVPAYDGKHPLKEFLGDFMDGKNKAYAANPALKVDDRAMFEQALRTTRRIFGDVAFHRPIARGKMSFGKSAPLADAILTSLAPIPAESVNDALAAKIKAALDNLSLTNPDFQRTTTRGTNGKGAIDMRLKLAREAVEAALKSYS